MKATSLSLTMVLLAVSAGAVTSSVIDGNWNQSATWNSGLPVNGQGVYIVSNNTVTFQAGDTYTGGNGTSGSGLEVGRKVGTYNGSGTLNMTGGTLNTGYFSVGHNTNGTLNISGGTLNANDVMWLGWGSHKPTSYVNVSGGTFNMTGNGTAYSIGAGARCDVNISGTGTVNVERAVGLTDSSVLCVGDANAVLNIKTNGFLNIRPRNASVEVGWLDVTNGASVNQSGGTNMTCNYYGNTVRLGYNASVGYYNLSGGLWQQNGYLRLGQGRSGRGVINQTGGTFELNHSIQVWGDSESSYTLAGGTFRAGSVAAEVWKSNSVTGRADCARFMVYSSPPTGTNTCSFKFWITGASGDVTLDIQTNLVVENGSTFDNPAATLAKIGPAKLTFGNAQQLQIRNGVLRVQEGTLETDGTMALGQGGANTTFLENGSLRTGYLRANVSMIMGYWWSGSPVPKAGVKCTFVQTGGTIDIGTCNGTNSLLVLGHSGAQGDYTLSNGVCSVSGSIYVGYGATAANSNGVGVVRVEGGSLVAGSLRVPEGAYAASGQVIVNGGRVDVTSNIVLNANGRLDIGAANNAFTTTSTLLSLKGGTLGLDLKGATNTMGRLDLDAASTLTIGGKSGCLTFAGDHAGVDWGSYTLTISGPLGHAAPSCLRFSHASRLSAAQLGRITCNGKVVLMDANGYLLEPAPGTLIRIF